MEAFLSTGIAAGTTLRHIVTAMVMATREGASEPAPALIERLRGLEKRARRADLERETVQVIASGRRLLGDPEDLSAVSRRQWRV